MTMIQNFKKAQVLNTTAKEHRTLLDHLKRFFDCKRVVKAIAHLKHHAKQIKALNPKVSEATSVEERQEAEPLVVKLAQSH